MGSIHSSTPGQQALATPLQQAQQARATSILLSKHTYFVSVCREGDLARVDMLISEARGHGDNVLKDLVNSEDQGWPPLHSACLKGHDGAVERLLAVGADIEALNKNGATAV